jgi:hypothetical protein
LDCLRYLVENGCVLTTDATFWAAAQGHFFCLQYLHQKGCPWDKETTLAAARNGNLDCLRYAIENGCPIYQEDEDELTLWQMEQLKKDIEKSRTVLLNSLDYRISNDIAKYIITLFI